MRARRRWWLGAAVLLIACSGSSQPGSILTPTPAATAVPSGVASSPPGAPVVPLRPPLPDPVAVHGTPLLRLWEGDDLGLESHVLTILDDGSVVDPWAVPFGGPAVRRVDPSGLRRILDAVTGTGAFSQSRSFDADPGWNAGFTWYRIELDTARGPVLVTASNASSDPLARRVVGVAESLRDLETMLSDEEWQPGGRTPRPLLASTALVAAWVTPLPDAVLDLPDETIDALRGSLPPGLPDLATPRLDALVDGSPWCVTSDGRAAAALQREVVRRYDPMTTGELADRIPSPTDPLLGGIDLASADHRHLVRLVWQPAQPGRPDPDCAALAAMPGPRPDRYAAGPASVARLAERGLALTAPPRIEALVVDLDAGVTTAHRWFFADGAVAMTDPPSPAAAFGVRRLTPAATRELDGLLGDASLPERDRAADVVENATRQYVLVTANGVRLEATDVETGVEARRIAALALRLGAADGWLDRDAWIDAQPLPFRPSRIAVSVTFSAAPLAPRGTWAMVGWPVELDPIGYDAGGVDTGPACSVLETDVASRLARALRRVAVPSGGSFRVAGPEPGTVIDVTFDVGEPGAPPSC